LADSCQPAVIAAEKGHRVTVYEKNDQPGGQLSAAANGPWGDEEFGRLINFYVTMLKKHGGELKLGTEATKEMLEELGTDVVVLATGATPDPSAYPGGDGPNVVSALDVMNQKVDVGKRVAIIGGTGVSISTALYLLDKGGHTVSMIGPQKKFGRDVNPSYIWRYMSKLRGGNVEMVTLCQVKEITDKGVVVTAKDSKDTLVEADTVVLANMTPVGAELREAVKKKDSYVIGDSLQVRRAVNALLDGYRLGMRI
jgi:2,4-dienoyl-CoA reductase (NADPH2)